MKMPFYLDTLDFLRPVTLPAPLRIRVAPPAAPAAQRAAYTPFPTVLPNAVPPTGF